MLFANHEGEVRRQVYARVPQIRSYEAVLHYGRPLVGFTAKRDYRSAVVTTTRTGSAGRHRRMGTSTRRPGRPSSTVRSCADVGTRDYRPEEHELFRLRDHMRDEFQKRVRTFVLASWLGYVRTLQEACAELGIATCDLNARDFRGWCFIDRVHMTDAGYRQAADMVAGALP